MNRQFINALAALAVVVLLNTSIYIVTEWEQAVITQFGRPVGAPVV